MLPQQIPLVTAPHQSQQAVCQQVGGGLMTSEQEDGTGGEQLLMRQQITTLLRLDEGRAEIGSVVLATRFDQRLEVRQQLLQPSLGALAAIWLISPDEKDARCLVGPLFYLLAVFDGHPQIF